MAPKKKNELEEIIEKSGNSFHSRVVRLLREKKWTVLVSPYYSDNFTDKPREIDIIAEKRFDIYGPANDRFGSITVQLFIECKYINTKSVFWFDAKDRKKAAERIYADTGMVREYQNATIKDHHYYIDVPVAKLFASSKHQGSEYDVLNKALNQNLNALVYYRDRGDISPVNEYSSRQTLARVPYPLIICNTLDHFYSVHMNDDSNKTESVTEPFSIEVNYAHIRTDGDSRPEYFLIDVISIDKVSDFLLMLEEKDIELIKKDKFFSLIHANNQRQGGGNDSAR